MAVRDAIRDGLVVGPRLFLAGRLLSITTATVGYYPGMYEVADGPDAGAAAARRQLARGADLIKVMATGAMLSSETEDARAIQFTLDELRAAVEIAHDNFKHVAAHAHALPGHRERGRGRRRQHRALHVRRRRRAPAHRRGRHLRRADHLRGRAALPRRSVVERCPTHLRQRMAEFNDVHLDHPPRPRARCAHRHGHRRRDAGQPPRAQRPRVRVHGARVRPVAGRGDRRTTINPAPPAPPRQTWGRSRWESRRRDRVLADPFDDIEELTHVPFVIRNGRVYRDDTAA